MNPKFSVPIEDSDLGRLTGQEDLHFKTILTSDLNWGRSMAVLKWASALMVIRSIHLVEESENHIDGCWRCSSAVDILRVIEAQV